MNHISESGSTYEVYVAGVNSAGVGESSTRIVFRTASKGIDDLIETSHHPYNQTECCIKSGVQPDCMPLCSYDASVTQVKALSGICADDMSKMIRCSAGGRDHLPCCARRGVPKQCQPLCQVSKHFSSVRDNLEHFLLYLGSSSTKYWSRFPTMSTKYWSNCSLF